MQIKKFPYNNFKIHGVNKTIIECLNLLYFKRLISLDNFSISIREGGSVFYYDNNDFGQILFNSLSAQTVTKDVDKEKYQFHLRVYKEFKNINGIVGGFPPYTFSILTTDNKIENVTSMLRKRNVKDLNLFLYERNEFQKDFLKKLILKGKIVADRQKMNFLLFLVKNYCVLSCGQNIFEAMTHYQNVEFNSKIEYVKKITTTIV